MLAYSKGFKQTKMKRQLRQNVAIVKPDKGNDVVLLHNQDHFNLVEQLFKDQTKMKILDKDSTIT